MPDHRIIATRLNPTTGCLGIAGMADDPGEIAVVILLDRLRSGDDGHAIYELLRMDRAPDGPRWYAGESVAVLDTGIENIADAVAKLLHRPQPQPESESPRSAP